MLFALSFAYLLLNTYTDYRPMQELPKWRGAQPITPSLDSASGYFRRQFLLASKPVRAYLIVSGTDEVTVYVNGKLAGTSRYFGAKTSEIFDIAGFLQRGNNLIAVAVDNHVPEAIPELTARLELQLADGSSRTLLSDSAWQVNEMESYQQSREAAWYSPEFFDLDWSPARVRLATDTRPTFPYLVPERIYEIFPASYWIWQQSQNNLNASFLRVIHLADEQINSAWLGVSAAGQYSINLNGVSLYSYTGSLRSMELFDIGPYVKRGDNRLLINVVTDVALPKLAISGVIMTAAGELDFGSDARWRTLKNVPNFQAAASSEAVVVLKPLRDTLAYSHLTLNFKKIETPIVEIWKRVKQFVSLSLMIFITIATGLLLLHLVSRRYDSVPLWRSLETLASPLLPVNVAIWILLIMSYDIRIGNETPFQSLIPVLIVAAILLWEGYIMFERFGRGRSTVA